MKRWTKDALQFGAVILSVFLVPFVVVSLTIHLLTALEKTLPAWFLRQLGQGFFVLFLGFVLPLLLTMGVLWSYARVYDAGYVPDEW